MPEIFCNIANGAENECRYVIGIKTVMNMERIENEHTR